MMNASTHIVPDEASGAAIGQLGRRYRTRQVTLSLVQATITWSLVLTIEILQYLNRIIHACLCDQ